MFPGQANPTSTDGSIKTEPTAVPESALADATPAPAEAGPLPAKKKHRIGWAELLDRVFAIDMKHCDRCGGDLKTIAAILETSAIQKILGHLGLPDKPPDIAPARRCPQMSFV